MTRNSLIALLVLALAVSACDWMPTWMGGKPEDKPKLPGTRVDVLPIESDYKPDEELKEAPFTLPPATDNADWPQHTGIFSAATANLGGKGDFANSISASAGDGDGFSHTLIPRPVVGGGMVFAMDAAGNVSAHDAANIESVKWKSKGVSEEDVDDVIGGGLAYDQGRLYATSGRGMVVALDAASGKEVWHKAIHIPFRSAPRVDNGRLFAVTIDNQTYALNAANGEVLWTHRGIDETAGLMNSVSPTVVNDIVLVPYSSGEIYVLSAADGNEAWSDSLSMDKHTEAGGVFVGIGGDPVIDGQVIFAVSDGGLLGVFYLQNGAHIWDRPVSSINTPWVVGDYMYLLSTDHTLICFVKYNGRIRWATQLRGYEDQVARKHPITWKGPVLVDGRLAVVGSNGQLLLIDATTGAIKTTQSIADNIYTSPVVAGGRMYLVGQDATLYSLQ